MSLLLGAARLLAGLVWGDGLRNAGLTKRHAPSHMSTWGIYQLIAKSTCLSFA